MAGTLTTETPNYITPVGFQKLKDELETLVKTERPKTVATVTWAASNGDRSENADYHYGKKRLREIDRRIRFLRHRLETAMVVDPKSLKGESVVFSATVTVTDEDGQKKTYQIVGEDEIDTSGGKISWKSPMSKALMGKRVGDEVLVKRPKGEVWLEISEVRFC